MSFLSRDSATQGIQLKVESVIVALGDQICTTSASTATINVGEQITSVRRVLFTDDSAGTVAPVTASNQLIVDPSTGLAPATPSLGTAVKLTLSAAFAVSDSIEVDFVTAE